MEVGGRGSVYGYAERKIHIVNERGVQTADAKRVLGVAPFQRVRSGWQRERKARPANFSRPLLLQNSINTKAQEIPIRLRVDLEVERSRPRVEVCGENQGTGLAVSNHARAGSEGARRNIGALHEPGTISAGR